MENGVEKRVVIKKFDRVDRIIVEVAKSIGFSSEAIKNREIYIRGGDMNAFTVSGDNSRIIVVIHTDLLERLTHNELRAVLAHELGHIRSLHSAKGAMHELFMRFILMNYSNPNIIQGIVPEMFNMAEAIWADQDHHPIIMSHGQGHKRRKGKKSMLMGDPSPIGKALITLMGLQAPQKDFLIKNYIALLINTLVAEKGSQESITYFTKLLNSAGDTANVLTIDIQDFAVQAKEAMNAISRAQEKSCDRYATANVPNEYVASTMAKLGGLPLQPVASLAREERTAIIEIMKQEVKDFYSQYGDEDISKYVGTSHPAIALRTVNILEIPSYPEILFANPFLRLLLMEDLLTEEVQTKVAFKKYLEAIRADILTLVDDFGLGAKTNARFNKMIQYYALNKRLKIQAAEAVGAVNLPEGLDENTRKFLENAQAAVVKDGSAKYLVLYQLEKEFKKQIRAFDSSRPAVEKTRMEERLAMLQKVLQSTDAEELRTVHSQVLPTLQTNAAVMSKSIPVDATNISNPYKEMNCRSLLMLGQAITDAAAASPTASPAAGNGG
jgi:Zn-dependent protease with chaperone function